MTVPIADAAITLDSADYLFRRHAWQGQAFAVRVGMNDPSSAFQLESGEMRVERFDVSDWTGTCVVAFRQCNADEGDRVRVIERLRAPWQAQDDLPLPVHFSAGTGNGDNAPGVVKVEVPASAWTQEIPIGGFRGMVPMMAIYLRANPVGGYDPILIGGTVKVFAAS